MSEESDETLLKRLAAGEERAARFLLARYLPRVLALAQRMLGSRSEAEDVAQEVFLRIWKQAARWQPGGARFSTWVHRVTSNLCIDRLRVRKSAPLEDAALIADPAPGAESRVAEAEQSARVAAALQSLPERQRLALILVHYQELGNRETAEIMDCTVEAVEALLTRARKGLKDLLLKDAAFDAPVKAVSGERQ
ncbi:ECF subfamily RNA polymerase sigma-24 factor [Tepidicaulis marinus]|uniref:ECF subfamily RNA polymerase sigma-24 factor n=1 Tax=Tepidicaulis marinus TaxID=1333998 RepID=A0A081BAW2_9HYPH|nr:RNA polymerase sigma factor [Tepidicaulis marinus]GAK45180.1 ECF subfamily RNA polymerase sigma-24 factor [Tepidicaulis marinus]